MYYPMLNPMDLGIYSEISGMNVMKANAISKAAIQGSRAFAILWTGTSPILERTIPAQRAGKGLLSSG